VTAADGAPAVGAGEGPVTGVRYYPVSPLKLVLLSVCTFSIYDLYWFYRQWKFVRVRDDSKIMPFWRAFFGVFWFYPLLREVDRSGARDRTASNVLLAIVYFLLAAIWRLPDPYWLLSFASTLCLLVLNQRIRALPGQPREELRAQGRLTVTNALVVLLLSPLVAFVTATSLYLLPGTQVVDGDRLWSWQMDFLRDEGLLDEGETVEYFYSEALLSIRAAGNVVTDQSLVTYFQDPDTGELLGGYAYYEDVAAIHVAYSDNPLEDSVIAVTDVDGIRFEMLASNEGARDKDFVAGIRRHFPGITTGTLAAYGASEPLSTDTDPTLEDGAAGTE
jgi:hypothetical protein